MTGARLLDRPLDERHLFAPLAQRIELLRAEEAARHNVAALEEPEAQTAALNMRGGRSDSSRTYRWRTLSVMSSGPQVNMTCDLLHGRS